MADRIPENQFTVDNLLKQSDPIIAMFKANGQAVAVAYKELIDGGVSEEVADELVKDMVHQFWTGTFNKQQGIQLPGLGGIT